MIEKEEITSTEFPEGGNTTPTKGPEVKAINGEFLLNLAQGRGIDCGESVEQGTEVLSELVGTLMFYIWTTHRAYVR